MGDRKPGAPAWLAVAFAAGLVVLFLGQRVVLELETASLVLSVLGAGMAVVSTLLRYAPQFRTQGEHARIASLLSSLQLIGVLGLLLYFVSTSAGLEMLGVDTSAAGDENLEAVLRVVWVSCLSLSCGALLFAEIALHPMRGADHLEARRVKTAASSGAVLAVAVTYGSLFVYAASETESQADFSYFKTSEPGEATVKLVQRFGEPIKVTAFFPEVSEVRAEVKNYLAQLKKQANNLEFQLIDRYLQPKLAKKLNVVVDGSIVIERGENKETLRIGTELEKARTKLKTLDEDFHSQLFKLLRTRRVAYLTIGHGELNDKDLGARREQGRSAEIMNEILELQNYRVKDLGLGQGLANEVPDDAGVVMVLGPVRPFAPEEIATLQRFVDGGGKLLLALDSDGISSLEADPGAGLDALVAGKKEETDLALATTTESAAGSAPTEPAPAAAPSAKAMDRPASASVDGNLQGGEAETEPASGRAGAWLSDIAGVVGINMDPTTIADASKFVPRRNNASDRVILFTNRFSSHASVSTLSRHSARAAVILSGAGHLEPDKSGPGKSDVTLKSFGSAFADANGNFLRDDDEKAKTFNFGVAVVRPVDGSKSAKPAEPKDDAAGDEDPKAEGDEANEEDGDAPPDEMRAFVVADADVFSDLLMSRFRDNRVLAADAIRWLGGEESLAGEFENEEDVRVEQTKQLDLVWFYSTIFGVPAVVLGSGLLLSRRLRRGGGK